MLRDEQLISTIKQGGKNGEKAILNLYTTYCRSVKAILTDLVADHPECRLEANDLMHDAFIMMIHKIQHETVLPIALKSFWLSIAKGLLKNGIRKNKNISLVEDFSESYPILDISPEAQFLILEEHEQFENLISKVGIRCKEILLLWLSLYSMQDIATRLQLSGPPIVRKLKSACFKKLKVLVREIKPY